MAKMTCCECRKNYEGKPLTKIPRHSSDENKHIGMCDVCMNMHLEFSKKSLAAHNDELKMNKIKKVLKEKHRARVEEDGTTINIPSKETIVKLLQNEIVFHSKGDGPARTRMDYNGHLIHDGKSNAEIVSDVEDCLLNNAENFIKRICKKLKR